MVISIIIIGQQPVTNYNAVNYTHAISAPSIDTPSGILFPAGMLDITRKVHTEVIDDILCKVYYIMLYKSV